MEDLNRRSFLGLAASAAACASCLTRYAADFDRAEALRIRAGMRIEAVASKKT